MPQVKTRSGKVKHFPYTEKGKMMAKKEMMKLKVIRKSGRKK